MKISIGPNIVILTTDQGYRLFDLDARTLARLNETAAFVIELADGTRSESEILEVVLKVIGADKADKCRKWIDKAVRQGLLVRSDAPPPLRKVEPETISEIATELRWNDDVQTAFVLQKHATELAADDPMQWYRLAELAHIVGRRAEAWAAYERYFSAHPDDAEIAHILTALRDDAPPSRASDDCIRQIYDRFATFYEENMCGDLDYRAPDHLITAVRSALPDRSDLIAADLGCGTGLFGMKLRPYCRRLVGMDLSPAMIDKAAARSIYDDLTTAELTEWLAGPTKDCFELMTCCDTLIYFGDLLPLLHGVRMRLKPGGLFAFTLEKGRRYPYELGDSGRFRHHRRHVRESAAAAGFEIVRQSENVLRREYGADVVGLVTVLRKIE
jgi:predicted TPR repeat methyltransferase